MGFAYAERGDGLLFRFRSPGGMDMFNSTHNEPDLRVRKVSRAEFIDLKRKFEGRYPGWDRRFRWLEVDGVAMYLPKR